jgi:hypothetical protein
MHHMRKTGWIVLLWLMAGIVLSEEPASPPSLAAFDEDVAVCRRVVREYCAIVQKMAPLPTVEKDQQAEGLRLLADARRQWTKIQSKYATNPPPEYAKDKTFKARLQDFANTLEDMERALAAGDARRSFQSCSFGCGLFVAMHEQNGLNYALDKLYHLRTDIKTTEAVMKTQGLTGVRQRMTALLQKRDAVLLAPPPFQPENAKAAAYAAAVDELSRAMDRLALAVATGDTKQVEEILANGLTLVNKPYGIAL